MSFIRIQGIGRVRGHGYRCLECRILLRGPEARHGSDCPSCGAHGTLENVAKVTPRMLAEAETA